MRLLLEESRAIKCPSISYHLLTTKKIQQVLSQQNVLEWYGAAIEWIANKLHTQICLRQYGCDAKAQFS